MAMKGLRDPKSEAKSFPEKEYTESLKGGPAGSGEYAKSADRKTGPNDPGYGGPMKKGKGKK
jgi:hypothetical protein